MPPIAGTARFENDIESCSSAVRISGRLIGTVPISAMAVAKLVRSEMTIATISQPRSALVTVSHSSCGLPTWLSRAKIGDERADRHHEVGAADPVELLERWLVGAGRRRGGRPDVGHLLRAFLAVAAVGPQVAAERRGLQVGERLDDRVVADAGAGGGDGAVVADEQRGAHEQLGDVGGPPARRRGTGRELEVGDADRACRRRRRGWR